ncbi:MAG: hypothetical protein KDH88_04560 [Chromatiales bacterium]|nr:hypothetical protein [Chromatiales bacterium]
MKMKKALLASAVASVLAAPMAQAINVSGEGTGEVLLYPYYNVNGSNVTFLALTNTTNTAKVLKVRFREGVGSEDVFDFTLYLSPFDTWNAAISTSGSNIAVFTADNSCTVPTVQNNPAAVFTDQRILDGYTRTSKLARMQEGHIEIIEMATLSTNTVDNNADTDFVDAADTNNQLAAAITHTNGVPANCATATTFTNAANGAIVSGLNLTLGGVSQRFNEPTGGVYGQAAVFNADNGVFLPYNATALNNFAGTPIWFPQKFNTFANFYTAGGPTPTLSGTDPNGVEEVHYATADPDVRTGVVTTGTLFFDLPDLSTPDSIEANATTGDGVGVLGGGDPIAQVLVEGNGITPTAVSGSFDTVDSPVAGTVPGDADGDGAPDLTRFASSDKRDAVTAALSAAQIQNDYITTSPFNTEWLVTFATQYLHVGIRETDLDAAAASVDRADPPFTVEERLASGQSCEQLSGLTVYSREEGTDNPSGVGFSPGVGPDSISLCYEVNVAVINDSGTSPSRIAGSSAVRGDFPLSFADGWLNMDVSNYSISSADGVDFFGLPAVGASFVGEGSGTQKGGAFGHRLIRSVAP